MPRELQRSGSNSLASLLRAEPPDHALAVADPRKLGERDGPRRRSRRSTRRRSCLRLPLGGAGGCRVCDCDEMDSAAALPRRRPPGSAEDGDEEDQDHDGALQCFSWKKGAAAAVPHRPSGPGADALVAVKESSSAAASLAVLPDDVTEMVLARLPLSSLLAARCACRRWRDLTAAPQFPRLRRGGTPWLFLFGADGGGGDAGWGARAAPSPAVHALDVDARRWRRLRAGALGGRFHFSVAAVGDELYVVGGRSGGSGSAAAAGGGKVKTHKGVLVFSPLAGSWRKAAPMRAARSRPVLGVFEMSATCSSVLHASAAENHVRRGGSRSRHGGAASAVYEDPHRLSLRRLRLKDMLNDEDADPTNLNKPAAGQEGGEEGRLRLAIVAVGGRGQWDEPLVSGEIYDPLTDRWVEIAGFPADVGLACSGAVCGRAFYVYCESDTLVAYHLDAGSWLVVQTSRPPPPRLRDYPPALACCASRLFMLCVSWCDDRRGPAASRREKVVRKLFELNLNSLEWTEAAAHPDAPMDPNAVFAAGRDRIYAVEMFRIFGKVLDFVTACRVSDTGEQRWSRVGRENAATEADAMSCRLKSMAVLHL
ncbi:unnamed protein product [Urochloa decumbens]|uniref:F-box domain-containing protein n=1 Tax=Urochloa decumbens TaxID=240449 RepID=A0ABC9FE50_9POAL